MIRFFRTQSVRQAGIRKILLFQGRLPRYLTYATGEDPLDTNGILSPVRDRIWVKRTNVSQTDRAVRPAWPVGRYGIWNLTALIDNHMAYLTARCKTLIHQFLPICSPDGTTPNFNQPMKNGLA